MERYNPENPLRIDNYPKDRHRDDETQRELRRDLMTPEQPIVEASFIVKTF